MSSEDERRRPRPVTDSEQAEHVVRCQHCGPKWNRYDLYKTGDVLRCPNCDGVMRP